jgi:hypothetical protein
MKQRVPSEFQNQKPSLILLPEKVKQRTELYDLEVK